MLRVAEWGEKSHVDNGRWPVIVPFEEKNTCILWYGNTRDT